MSYDLQKWHDKFKKPLIVTEFGADTVVGLHTVSFHIFTKIQKSFINHHLKHNIYIHLSFDTLCTLRLLTLVSSE